MKYSTIITGWGEDALSFLEEHCLVLFDDDVSEELTDISLVHTKEELLGDICVGDTLIICNKVYEITAVGSEANRSMRGLGHCTLSFKGGSEAELPGYIVLEGEPFSVDDVALGGKIEIY